jgi:hypothetical protein
MSSEDMLAPTDTTFSQRMNTDFADNLLMRARYRHRVILVGVVVLKDLKIGDLTFEAVCMYLEEHRHVSAPTFLPASLPAPAQETSREVAAARNRSWCRIGVTGMELRGLTEVGRWFETL